MKDRDRLDELEGRVRLRFLSVFSAVVGFCGLTLGLVAGGLGHMSFGAAFAISAWGTIFVISCVYGIKVGTLTEEERRERYCRSAWLRLFDERNFPESEVEWRAIGSWIDWRLASLVRDLTRFAEMRDKEQDEISRICLALKTEPVVRDIVPNELPQYRKELQAAQAGVYEQLKEARTALHEYQDGVAFGQKLFLARWDFLKEQGRLPKKDGEPYDWTSPEEYKSYVRRRDEMERKQAASTE